MRTQSSDTTLEAEQAQIAALRRLGPRGRIGQMVSLSRLTRRWSLDALRRSRPELTERELKREWISLIYGEDLVRSIAGDRCG